MQLSLSTLLYYLYLFVVLLKMLTYGLIGLDRYRLVPMGSNSKIIKIDDQSTYELYVYSQRLNDSH